ncbi:MAG: ABC transporter permease [Proteobacteria bacterium]|nr:ABC transporter permease [Pseudomonadota bacterium]
MRLINRRLSRGGAILAGIVPFALALAVYGIASQARLSENPDDKLLPAFSSFAQAIDRMALEPSRRTGEYLFWKDTLASLRRLAKGVAGAAAIGLVFGVSLGVIPWVGSHLSPFVRALSMIPPMAILPVLFIVFGLGESAKVALIIIGSAPFLVREIEQRVRELPREQFIKAQTLGASSWQIITRVVLPQIVPRLVDAVRLTLGSAWLFLIAAEAIASTEGLGYRIFLVRRYLSMDVILPYVVWITVLAFALDALLRRVNGWVFPWYGRAT